MDEMIENHTKTTIDNQASLFWVERMPRITTILACILILISLSLMVRDLGDASFWFDEVYTYAMVTKNPLDIIKMTATRDVHPPLHYLLAHYWVQIYGADEAGLRSLSVLFGVLSLITLYFLGRRLFGERPALISLAFASFSPIIIKLSQEARYYTLFLFLGVLTAYFLIRAYQGHGQDKYAQWGLMISSGLFLYSHAMASFVIFGFILAIISTWNTHRIFAKKSILSISLSILSFIPWVAVLLLIQIDFAQKVLGLSYWGYSFHYRLLQTLGFYLGVPALIYPFVAAVVLGSIMMVIRYKNEKIYSILILSLLIFPHLFPALLSYFGKPLYLGRITMPSVCSFFLLAGYGFSRFFDWKRLNAVSLSIAIVLVFSIATAQLSYLNKAHFDVRVGFSWREAGQLIENDGKINDVILISADFTARVLRHYYRGPIKIVGHSREMLFEEDSFERLVGSLCDSQRLWLVLSHRKNLNLDKSDIYKFLVSKYFKEISRRDGRGVKIALFKIPEGFNVSHKACSS